MRTKAYCKYHKPWVNTSKGWIESACVDDEAQTIRQCEWTRNGGCDKFPAKHGIRQCRHLLECKGCKHLVGLRPKKILVWHCDYTGQPKRLTGIYGCPKKGEQQ